MTKGAYVSAIFVVLAAVALAEPLADEGFAGKPFAVRSLLCVPSYGHPCPQRNPYAYPQPYFYPPHFNPFPRQQVPRRPFNPGPFRGGSRGSGSGSGSSGGRRGFGSGSGSSGGRRGFGSGSGSGGRGQHYHYRGGFGSGSGGGKGSD